MIFSREGVKIMKNLGEGLRNLNPQDIGKTVLRNRTVQGITTAAVITGIAAFGGKNADINAYQQPNLPTHTQTENEQRDYNLTPVKTEIKAVMPDALPENLPEWIEFFPQASFSLVPEGNVRVITSLKEGEIQVSNTQVIEIAGQRFSVDPEKHPEKTLAIAVIAGTDVNYEFKIPAGVSIWTGKEKTSRTDLSDRVNDAITAAKVQGNRAGIPGNCTPKGCESVDLLALFAHQNSRGQAAFDLIAYIPDIRTR